MKTRNKNGQFKKGSIVLGKDHNRYKHGMTGTRPYKIWSGIKRRCNNKNDIGYKYYYGKGIKMSNSWLDFQNFWNDMKDTYFNEATIDRIDNSKGYSKENCRWATVIEQARNKDGVVLYEYKGEELPLSVIAKKVGMNNQTLALRIKSGWKFEDAITIPTSLKNKNLRKYV